MPLEPVTAAILNQMATANGPKLEDLAPAQGREMYRMLQPPAPDITVGSVDDRTIPGPAGAIPIRVYKPQDAGNALPVHVFFHGGGWVIGDLDTHDAYCRELCRLAGCIVVAVDYRLAPEHPFPAAVDDAWAAINWVAENGASLGADTARISVGGDSAGGNLSAVVAQMARDNGGPRLCFQLLIYPATDLAMDTPSHRENAEGYMLTRGSMNWFLGHYCPALDQRSSARLSPLKSARFDALPPAYVITAEFDPLRDEGEAYAERMREAGVPVECHRYDGMIHGFVCMFRLIPAAHPALEKAAAALRAAHDAAAR
jgi:acetyl esterase